jgi:hypothetical protein
MAGESMQQVKPDRIEWFDCYLTMRGHVFFDGAVVAVVNYEIKTKKFENEWTAHGFALGPSDDLDHGLNGRIVLLADETNMLARQWLDLCEAN